MLGGLALLGVEVDQQDQVGRVRLEGRLDGVMHLRVGVHRALALDRHPVATSGSCTRGRRWSADSAAGCSRRTLQVEIVLGAVLEVGEVLAVEVVEAERHPEIVGLDRHFFSPSPAAIANSHHAFMRGEGRGEGRLNSTSRARGCPSP